MTTTFKVDTRTALLEAGKNIMFEKGYSNTGIQEVLNSVGVPKGSFYHYFNSKEDFALKIIEYSDQVCGAKAKLTLTDTSVSPTKRLMNYCYEGKNALNESKCRKGCFIGNLSQEMADQSEVLRKALSAIMSQWKELFAQCIKEGQKTKEISKAWPADKMAELFLSGWEGALMRAKTIKNVEPLNDFTDLMFNHILNAK
jgi:TetR/AcrR family transcriptional regulator, transcriptional repressor for nem operon